ncbi:MAG: efflux RND transporter periplasmic adaptor subunit [Pikeienuella sp.]
MTPSASARRAATALLALAALWPASAHSQAPGAARPAPAVVVAPAEISDLRAALRLTGRLVAGQQVELRARVSGFLEEISFTEGATVSAGDRLFKIDDDPFRAVVSQIDGAISAAEAERRLAEIERDRKAQLVERQTVAQSELDIALANLGKAEGEIARLRGERDRAQLDVDYTEIAAPFDGVIGLSAFDLGALVGPESGALATLTALDPMTAEFRVTTADWLAYRKEHVDGTGPSTAVALTLADGADYDLPGRIDFVDAVVARGTDTLLVRAIFDNPDGLLLDGALVTVSLRSDAPEMVLSVPQRAVQRDQAGAFVLVVDAASKVELRRVEVARVSEGRSVISEGLEEGEQVITEGVNKVRPGIEVDAALAGNG